MISLISDNKQAIANLCREFQIKKLDVFGSASTGAFDSDTSDLAFIVDLGEYNFCTSYWRLSARLSIRPASMTQK